MAWVHQQHTQPTTIVLNEKALRSSITLFLYQTNTLPPVPLPELTILHPDM